MNPFVEIVTQLLKEQKISKNQMLKDLNLSRNSFVDWNKRGTIPNAKVVSAIADYLGTTITTLMGYPENEDENSYGSLGYYFPDLKIESKENIVKEFDEKFILLFQQLNEQNRDIIIGDMQKYIKEQWYDSVAADEPLKKTGTNDPKK